MPTLKSRRSGTDLRKHPSVKTWADRLREVPDEVIRQIADSKDVGTARSRIAGMLVILDRAEATDWARNLPLR